MSALFKRPSVGNEAISRIQRDVAALDRDIRYLSTRLPQETLRDVGVPDEGAAGRLAGVAGSWLPFGGARREGAAAGEGRLPELLSGSVETTRQVAAERRVARHRGVVLAVFAVMWVVWLMARLG